MHLAQDPFGPLTYAHFQNVDHEMEERHFCASFNMLLSYKWIHESQEKKYKKLKCADKWKKPDRSGHTKWIQVQDILGKVKP